MPLLDKYARVSVQKGNRAVGGHHLVLGELRDFLTGEIRPDTHDERYRQKIARLLVEVKGFGRETLTPHVPISIRAGVRRARVWMDLTATLAGRTALLVKYAPGSLITRHQVAIAASRLLGDRQVPFSVVTNGEDADMLDNIDGAVVARGLDGILTREALEDRLSLCREVVVTPRHREMAARILFAFEVDGRCPCDETACDIDGP